MNPIPVDLISPTVVNILVAFFAKVLEGSGKKWAESIYDAVKEKLGKKESSKEVLDELHNFPSDQDLQASVRVHLKKAILEDKAFQQELMEKLSEIANLENREKIAMLVTKNYTNELSQIFGSSVNIDQKQISSTATVGDNATVFGDVSAIVNFVPDDASDADSRKENDEGK